MKRDLVYYRTGTALKQQPYVLCQQAMHRNMNPYPDKKIWKNFNFIQFPDNIQKGSLNTKFSNVSDCQRDPKQQKKNSLRSTSKQKLPKFLNCSTVELGSRGFLTLTQPWSKLVFITFLRKKLTLGICVDDKLEDI